MIKHEVKEILRDFFKDGNFVDRYFKKIGAEEIAKLAGYPVPLVYLDGNELKKEVLSATEDFHEEFKIDPIINNLLLTSVNRSITSSWKGKFKNIRVREIRKLTKRRFIDSKDIEDDEDATEQYKYQIFFDYEEIKKIFSKLESNMKEWLLNESTSLVDKITEKLNREKEIEINQLRLTLNAEREKQVKVLEERLEYLEKFTSGDEDTSELPSTTNRSKCLQTGNDLSSTSTLYDGKVTEDCQNCLLVSDNKLDENFELVEGNCSQSQDYPW